MIQNYRPEVFIEIHQDEDEDSGDLGLQSTMAPVLQLQNPLAVEVYNGTLSQTCYSEIAHSVSWIIWGLPAPAKGA